MREGQLRFVSGKAFIVEIWWCADSPLWVADWALPPFIHLVAITETNDQNSVAEVEMTLHFSSALRQVTASQRLGALKWPTPSYSSKVMEAHRPAWP